VAVAAAFLIRSALARAVGPGLPAYLLFYPAVMLTALAGDVGPGILATALSCLLSVFWILPVDVPAPGPREAIGLAIFGSMGSLMSIVTGRYHEARRRLAEHEKERAVQASERRYRGLFENIRDSVTVLEAVRGPEGRPVDWEYREANETALGAVGLSRQEVLGQRASRVQSEEAARSQLRWRQVLETGTSSSYETSRGGLDSFVRIFRIDESSIGIAALDITDRKRAERAMRESEGRLRLALDAANAGSWEWDLRSDENVWSDGVWRLLELEPGSCVPSQQALLGAILPEDRPGAERAVQAAASQGLELTAEWRVRSRTTGSCWIMIRGRPVRDARGEVVRYAGIVLDISDRKRSEEALRAIEREGALRESEARFRGLIEHSTDLIVVLDAEEAVRFWSPGAAAALGWREDGVLGRKLMDLVSPDDADALSRALQSVRDERATSAPVTSRLRHQDGSWRVIESVARNLLSDPVLKGIVVNARDVTEQHRLREQVQEAQKLESIGRLAGGVAHDFNNLLTAILGSAEAAREDLDAGRGASRDDIEAIREAGDRARQLTRQLLAFARRQTISPRALDLNRVVEDGRNLLRRILPENISLSIALGSEPCLVLADGGQLQQVILNLAVNSGDAMPSGGRLDIEAAEVELDDREAEALGTWAAPGRFGRLTVRDSGTGLSAEARAHLFEPFFTTKPRGRGTGLGLATVYGIVKQSDGFIGLESEPGKGTTFHVYLPRSTRLPEAAQAAAPSPSLGGTETVLVVEDEPLVRKVAVGALRRAGYRVVEAAGGAEALDAMAPGLEALALLVTDVVMPGMDGRALATELQRRRPGLRVLFMSGYPGDHQETLGDLASSAGFLQKPFTGATLVAAVRTALDASRPGRTMPPSSK
jgi:PAS domain S-box-containing protein